MSKIQFDTDLVVLGRDLPTKEAVIVELAARLLAKGFVTESYPQAVLNRESRFPTGLPTEPIAIAIPHADPEHCLVPALACAVLKEPVTFGLMGDDSATVSASIVLLLALSAEKQVQFLSHLSDLFSDGEALQQLHAMTSPADVVQFLGSRIDFHMAG